ncbi:MAG: hypothetical protein ABSB97_01725 [Thermoplasmata archaeon]|jgi:hypothetical protein
MPQVMIGLSARDYRTTNEVWRLAKRHLNPAVRRRIGWRGRSSFLRQLMFYGFEKASADPAAFLRDVRDTHDPLFGKRGRSDAGSDRRESMVGAWQAFFPSPSPTPSLRRRSGKAETSD